MHIYHAHKTLQMREAQGVQSCVPGPASVAPHHPLPDPDTSPGDSPWYPNPKSGPFIHFFPGLNSPVCSVSSPSWCRDHTGISSLVWLWDEHSSQHCWSHGDNHSSCPSGDRTEARHIPQLRDHPHNHWTGTNTSHQQTWLSWGALAGLCPRTTVQDEDFILHCSATGLPFLSSQWKNAL